MSGDAPNSDPANDAPRRATTGSAPSSTAGGERESFFDPRVGRVFSWISERMLRKSFAALRVERESCSSLEALRRHPGAIVLLLNHPSWWEPIVVAFLRRRWFPDRSVIAAMDAHELARFAIFRRLGVIGLDPDDPASARRLRAEVSRRLRSEPRALVAITPQGRLTDPREPIEVRPGAAILLADHPTALAATVTLEYPFWSSKRPEALLRVRSLPAPPDAAPRAWHALIGAEMERGRRELAALAMARDERAFETAVSGGGGGGPYAWWLRLTGRGHEIDASRRRGTASPGPSARSREASA